MREGGVRWTAPSKRHPLAREMRVPEETMNFAQRIRTNALLVLYNYWKELRGSRPYPTRADIDPSMIPDVLPNIGLFELEAAPRRYRICLMGRSEEHTTDLQSLRRKAYTV